MEATSCRLLGAGDRRHKLCWMGRKEKADGVFVTVG